MPCLEPLTAALLALTLQLEAFQLPRDTHYFNCVYMDPLPRASVRARVEAMTRKRLPTNIVLPDNFWNADGLRALFSQLVNAGYPSLITIQAGVSYAVPTAARNLSVDAILFDVEAVQPDALICVTYKWLLGPCSVSLAYFGPRFDYGVPLEETWIERGNSQDFQSRIAMSPSRCAARRSGSCRRCYNELEDVDALRGVLREAVA